MHGIKNAYEALLEKLKGRDLFGGGAVRHMEG
jgi:hypothetical protein